MRYTASPPLKLLRRLVRSVEQNGVGGAIAHSYQRLVRSVRTHGLSGTWERAFRKAPAAPPEFLIPDKPHPFDLQHGTDTGGWLSSGELSGNSLSSLYSTAYYGVPPSTLRQAIRSLPIDPAIFTFIDLGCGKGRALLVAAEFAFPRLMGVEIAPELCRVAETNISRNPDWTSRAFILNQDAATVQFPISPLLIFLYNPFLAPVLRRALANLEQQLRRAPREVWILYGDNPRYTKVLERFPFIREISESRYAISPEDLTAEPPGFTHVNFTVYSATLP